MFNLNQWICELYKGKFLQKKIGLISLLRPTVVSITRPAFPNLGCYHLQGALKSIIKCAGGEILLSSKAWPSFRYMFDTCMGLSGCSGYRCVKSHLETKRMHTLFQCKQESESDILFPTTRAFSNLRTASNWVTS